MTGDEIAHRLARCPGRTGRSDDATARLLGDSDPSDPGIGPPPAAKLIDAAVLVPLVARDDGLTVLLTQRTSHLAHHGGQVSFPGGHAESFDRDAVATALREAEEEVGLKSDKIDVLGRLDDYVTVTGFRVVPVVGLVHPPLPLAPDPFEVADVFEVPLDFLLDPRNHRKDFRLLPSGRKRYYYAMPFQEHYIWGATAGMLMNLYEVLADPCGF